MTAEEGSTNLWLMLPTRSRCVNAPECPWHSTSTADWKANRFSTRSKIVQHAKQIKRLAHPFYQLGEAWDRRLSLRALDECCVLYGRIYEDRLGSGEPPQWRRTVVPFQGGQLRIVTPNPNTYFGWKHQVLHDEQSRGLSTQRDLVQHNNGIPTIVREGSSSFRKKIQPNSTIYILVEHSYTVDETIDTFLTNSCRRDSHS